MADPTDPAAVRPIRSIGIYVFDGVDEVDVVGPWEVLTTWRHLGRTGGRDAPCSPTAPDVFTLALRSNLLDGGAPPQVRGAKGLRIGVDYVVGPGVVPPHMDLLIVTGGPPDGRLERQMYDPELTELIAGLQGETSQKPGETPQKPLVTAVCVGSLILAKKGFLKDQSATTHHAALDTLAELDETIRVIRDQRVVDSTRERDGVEVITCGGITASIDMALHLVLKYGGEDCAKAVAKYLEYCPEPPVEVDCGGARDDRQERAR